MRHRRRLVAAKNDSVQIKKKSLRPGDASCKQQKQIRNASGLLWLPLGIGTQIFIFSQTNHITFTYMNPNRQQQWRQSDPVNGVQVDLQGVRLFAAAVMASKFSRPAPGQTQTHESKQSLYKPGKAPRQLRATFRVFPRHAPPPGLLRSPSPCQHAVSPRPPPLYLTSHAARSRTARGLTLFYAT